MGREISREGLSPVGVKKRKKKKKGSPHVARMLGRAKVSLFGVTYMLKKVVRMRRSQKRGKVSAASKNPSRKGGRTQLATARSRA